MATRLKDLRMTKVALVPAGANPDAHIMLYKAQEAPITKEVLVEIELESMPLTTAQRLEQSELWAQWQPLWSAFCESMWELLDKCHEGEVSQYAPAILQSIQEFQARAQTILSGLGMLEKAAPLFAACAAIEKAGRAMSAQRMAQLKAAIGTLQKILDEAGGLMEKGDGLAVALNRQIDAMVTESRTRGDIIASMASAAGIAESTVSQILGGSIIRPPDERLQGFARVLGVSLSRLQRLADADVEKGQDMPGAEDVKDMQAQLATLTKRVEAADARVQELEGENAALKKQLEPEPTEEDFLKAMPEAMRKRWEANERQTKEALETARVEKEKRERREYIEKVAAYKPLGLVADDDWELLQAIDKMDVKPRTRLLQVLKSACEVIKQSSLFSNLGGNRPAHGGGTAWAQAEALALELVAKGQAKTKEQAISKVFEDNPELRQQYQAEKRGA